jgi:hypothetical protein
MKQLAFSRRGFLHSIGLAVSGLIWSQSSRAGSRATEQSNLVKVLTSSILNQENIIPPLSRKHLDMSSTHDELEAKLQQIVYPKNQLEIVMISKKS